MSKYRWACGVTTVPSRFNDLLPRTLKSLKLSGFDEPRLFVDGLRETNCLLQQQGWCHEITYRWPVIRTYGNWILSLIELWVRNPTCERFAMFQDDFVISKNTRQYLDRIEYPKNGYWNLYTFPSNQLLAPVGDRGRVRTGWYESNQFGRGAVALVFSRDAVLTLLSNIGAAHHLAERPLDVHRGHRAVDGGIVTAFTKAGWKEYVHNPSLTQHIGTVSAMGNKPHKSAISFRGEEFDAMTLLNEK